MGCTTDKSSAFKKVAWEIALELKASGGGLTEEQAQELNEAWKPIDVPLTVVLGQPLGPSYTCPGAERWLDEQQKADADMPAEFRLIQYAVDQFENGVEPKEVARCE